MFSAHKLRIGVKLRFFIKNPHRGTPNCTANRGAVTYKCLALSESWRNIYFTYSERFKLTNIMLWVKSIIWNKYNKDYRYDKRAGMSAITSRHQYTSQRRYAVVCFMLRFDTCGSLVGWSWVYLWFRGFTW